MTDAAASDARTDLVDELELIEQQPLEQRAPSFAVIHDRLQAELGSVRD